MKISISQIFNIFLDELKMIWKDPGTRLIMILGVFLYSSVYGLAFYNQVAREVPIAVVDMDKSQYSSLFIRSIDATEQVKVAFRSDSTEEAKKQYYLDNTKAYIVIPRDFEKDILSNKQTNVLLYADSAYLIVYKSVYSGTLSAVANMSAKIATLKTYMKSGEYNKAIAIQAPIDYVSVPLYNASSGYEDYILPVILILILQQTMLVGIGLLSGYRREKKDKYCEFSDNPFEIVLGRSLAYVSLYSVYASIYFFVFPIICKYNLYWNPTLTIFVMLIYLITLSFFVQTMNIFFKEREESLILLVMGSISLVFLAGVVWPKNDIPFLIRVIADFIPSTQGIDALVRINQMNATFSQVSTTVLWLTLLSVLYFILSVLVVKYLVKEKQK